MIKVVLTSILVITLIACGGKKDPDKNDLKDSLDKVNVNVTENDSVKSNSKTNEVVIVDSNDVNTNTEVLDQNGQLDPNSSPQAVVQTIIKAAKTSKYGPLLKLSNPAITMDGDAKNIINIASASEEEQKGFKEYFGNAKIIGKPRINKGRAEVDIETTAEGGEKETIKVQQKLDKWYLVGF